MEVDSDDEWRLNVGDDWESDGEGEVRAKSTARVIRRTFNTRTTSMAMEAPTRGDYALTLPKELGVLAVAQIHKSELGTVVWNAAVILCEWLGANAVRIPA